MSYSIQRSNGTVAATINDGEYDDTSTSLTLVGQNFVGYGEFLQTNIVKIMENFAYSQGPTNPSIGQLWFNTTSKVLSVRTSNDPAVWKPLSSMTASASAPTGSIAGDTWFNTATDQFFANNGAKWSLVGPSYTREQGVTGANVLSISDGTQNHLVTSLEIGGVPGVIWSTDDAFTPDPLFDGFEVINPGFNITSSFTGSSYNGTVNNSTLLNGIADTGFLRADQDSVTTGNLAIQNDDGLWLGSALDFQITTDPLTKDVTIKNAFNGGDFNLVGTYDSSLVTLLSSDVSTGLLTINADPVDDLGVATKQYVDSGVASAIDAASNALTTNVNAINDTLGVLTGEINDVSVYAQNLNTTKADIASPALTGTPEAPTASPGTNTTQLATTEFVFEANTGVYDALIDVTTDITNNIVSNYAPLVSPALTGNPIAPTASPGTNTTQLATTEFVRFAVDTANNAATSVLGIKSNIASPTFTGAPKAPTAAVTTANTQIATTAFVHGLLPTGVILMWSGSVVTIPNGWALCNGTNGTPNLTDRFIMGAGNTYNPGVSGGGSSQSFTTATAGSHTHNNGLTGPTALSTNQIPSHQHNFTDVYAIVGDHGLGGSTASDRDRNGTYIYPSFYAGNASDGDQDNGAYGFPSITDAAGAGQEHTHSIAANGAHSHSVTVSTILPAYYALCYIMKTV